jgi:hypothetical protein
MWGILLGVVVVGGIGSLYWSVSQRQAQLDALDQDLKSMKGKFETADQMLARFNYGQTYLGARPPVLECFREITLALRDDEQLWVTSINLRDSVRDSAKDPKGAKPKGTDKTCTLAGKATDQKTIISLAGRLSKNPKFSDVRTLQITEVVVSGGKSKEQSFTIQFNFAGTE